MIYNFCYISLYTTIVLYVNIMLAVEEKPPIKTGGKTNE